MTRTNVLATKETVKALESMDFAPIKVLEALGYNYTEKDDCVGRNEEWKEHRYTGINPDNPEDIAIVTVGERDAEQYIYLEDKEGWDWRYEICVKDGTVISCREILTPEEAVRILKEFSVGKRLEGHYCEEEIDDDDDIETIDWDDICTEYDLQLHGTSWIEAGSEEYRQVGFDEVKVAVLYVATEDAPEVTIYMYYDGEIYDVD